MKWHGNYTIEMLLMLVRLHRDSKLTFMCETPMGNISQMRHSVDSFDVSGRDKEYFTFEESDHTVTASPPNGGREDEAKVIRPSGR